MPLVSGMVVGSPTLACLEVETQKENLPGPAEDRIVDRARAGIQEVGDPVDACRDLHRGRSLVPADVDQIWSGGPGVFSPDRHCNRGRHRRDILQAFLQP